MSRIVRTPRAERDLREIWSYVAVRDDAAADRLLDRILTTLNRLADHPFIGSAQPGIRNDLRKFPVGRYGIYDHPTPDGICLIRVLHSARDIAAIIDAD